MSLKSRSSSLTRLVVCLAAALVIVDGRSQGTLIFNNNSDSLVRRVNWPSPDSPVEDGYVQLLFAATGTPFLAPRIEAPLTLQEWLRRSAGWKLGPISSVAEGLFQGGEVALEGLAPGTSVDFIVLGWSGAESFDVAIEAYGSGYWGASTMMQNEKTIMLGGGDNSATPLTEVFRGVMLFSSAPIPEPSSAGLCGLGMLAWGVASRLQSKCRHKLTCCRQSDPVMTKSI